MIAIHLNSGSFSERWITYCIEHGLPHKPVDCLSSDIVEQLRDCSVLLWHWAFHEPRSALVARPILAAVERMGLIVFPNVSTCWHYDDKIAQKYLLEAARLPLIPTWVFTTASDAKHWIKSAAWPKVFKLRCGAGSTNVRLVRSQSDAFELCRQAFGSGFPAAGGYLVDLQTRLRKTKTSVQFWDKLRRAPRTILFNLALRRQMPRQRGYLYFQEFMPNNEFDTRITVIGERAFGFRRANRREDFRASGSGSISYDPEKIDKRCIEVSFQVASRIGSQSLAIDLLFNPHQEPVISEISYVYVPSAVQACLGFWDRKCTWHNGHIWPQDAIIEDVLSALDKRVNKELP